MDNQAHICEQLGKANTFFVEFYDGFSHYNFKSNETENGYQVDEEVLRRKIWESTVGIQPTVFQVLLGCSDLSPQDFASHTCPILSTRFQWTKPGVRRSLVEK